MPDEFDWELTTFEGNRRRQHQEFQRLPFREKLAMIEQMTAVVEHFAAAAAKRRAAQQPTDAGIEKQQVMIDRLLKENEAIKSKIGL